MIHLTEAEKNLMDIIWDANNIHSKDLVDICFQKFNWKKSTTYTMLKKLIKKEMVDNDHAIVSYKISRESFMYSQKKHVIEKYFDNSLPSFINAFANEEKLTEDDIRELEKIIEKYK